jgi:hypothetical protein
MAKIYFYMKFNLKIHKLYKIHINEKSIFFSFAFIFMIIYRSKTGHVGLIQHD